MLFDNTVAFACKQTENKMNKTRKYKSNEQLQWLFKVTKTVSPYFKSSVSSKLSSQI